VQLPAGIWRSPASISHFWLDVNLTSNQIAVLIVAAIVAVALWFMLRHTRLGLQMRAVVDKPIWQTCVGSTTVALRRSRG
jgi:branched-subunit amino acid ABC-type transport system permease component